MGFNYFGLGAGMYIFLLLVVVLLCIYFLPYIFSAAVFIIRVIIIALSPLLSLLGMKNAVKNVDSHANKIKRRFT
jgi:hypothetical protein